MNVVYPQMKSFCYQFGYHFNMVDLYWGRECTLKEYSIAFDAHYLKRAINEIKLCQEFSSGPSFIVSKSCSFIIMRLFCYSYCYLIAIVQESFL